MVSWNLVCQFFYRFLSLFYSLYVCLCFLQSCTKLFCHGFLAFLMKDRANEIYKRVEDQKSSRGRNQDALLAACLYIACRQEDKPRTVKGTKQFHRLLYICSLIIHHSHFINFGRYYIEICSVANGATKKEIGRAKEYIVKQLGLETGQSVEMGTIHAGDFMVSS